MYTPAASTFPRLLMGALLLAALLAATGCKTDPYALPDPPPEDRWINLNAADEEDPQAAIMRYLEARGVAISLYSALNEGRWAEATRHMSQETRSFLEDGAAAGGAAGALEAGEVSYQGQTFGFVPADIFFINDLERIEDSVEGAPPENETERRKELYAISSDGRARKMVFILEADTWRLHSPYFNTETFNVGAAQ